MSKDQSKNDEKVVIEMEEVNKKKKFWTNVLTIGGGILLGGVLVYALGGKDTYAENALDTTSNDLLGGDTMDNLVSSGDSETVE